MAALPYIQLYVADYLADTMHLSTEEHGAYLLIIFNYWQTGKPIPEKRLPAISKLNERWTSVEVSLKEYFNVVEGVWHHHRIDADLEAVNEKQKQRSDAGKSSARARAATKQAKKKEESASVPTTVATTVDDSLQRNGNYTDTDTDTDIYKEKKKSTKKPRATISYQEMKTDFPDLKEQTASDWLTVRKAKKAPLTPTAWGKIVGEINKSGLTGEKAIGIAAERSWQGIKAEWLTDHAGDNKDQNYKEFCQ